MDLFLNYELSDIIKAVALTVLCVLALWETGKKIVEILNAYYKKKKAVDKHSENVKSLSDNDKQQDEMIHILLQKTLAMSRMPMVLCISTFRKAGYYEQKRSQALPVW